MAGEPAAPRCAIDSAMALTSQKTCSVQVNLNIEPDTLFSLAELAHARGESFDDALSYMINSQQPDNHFYENLSIEIVKARRMNGGAQ